MPPTKTFPIVDRLVPGGLEALLRAARSNRESYGQIADRLRADYGVEVSSQTVSNWCRELGIEKATVPA